MATTVFHAPDISCGGCANAIRRTLGGLVGVNEVSVDVPRKTIEVRYEEPAASRETIQTALDRAGFPATDTSSQN